MAVSSGRLRIIKDVTNDTHEARATLVLRDACMRRALLDSGICIPSSTGTATSASHQNHSQMWAWYSSPWTTAAGRSSGEARFHAGGPGRPGRACPFASRRLGVCVQDGIELDSDRHS